MIHYGHVLLFVIKTKNLFAQRKKKTNHMPE